MQKPKPHPKGFYDILCRVWKYTFFPKDFSCKYGSILRKAEEKYVILQMWKSKAKDTIKSHTSLEAKPKPNLPSPRIRWF